MQVLPCLGPFVAAMQVAAGFRATAERSAQLEIELDAMRVAPELALSQYVQSSRRPYPRTLRSAPCRLDRRAENPAELAPKPSARLAVLPECCPNFMQALPRPGILGG